MELAYWSSDKSSTRYGKNWYGTTKQCLNDRYLL